MPGDVTGTTCFAGSVYSQLPATRRPATGATATFTQAQLQPYEALTVVVGAPLASVEPGAAAPILDERFSITRAFSVTPATIGGVARPCCCWARWASVRSLWSRP